MRQPILSRRAGLWPTYPVLAVILVLLIVPLAVMLSYAFITYQQGRVVSSELTLRHFGTTLADPIFWRWFWRSTWIAVATTAACILLGFPVALVYTRLGRAGRAVLLVLVVSPLLTSVLVRAYAWYVILGGRRGMLNTLLLGLGLVDTPVRILNTDYAVLIGMVQVHLPFMILPLMASLVARDRSIEEASTNLGAGAAATFFRVTLPLSVPALATGAALVFALSYTTFVIPQVLGGGSYTTLAVKVYDETTVVLNWSRAAVIAFLLVLSCFGYVLAIVLLGQRCSRWLKVRQERST
jgi:ABC-type spermidine/putrescine transport system permease subunit I